MDIYDRILRRAENLERSKAEVRAQFSQSAIRQRGSAIAQWKREIAVLVDAGTPRAQAASKVNLKFPGLRARVVAAANMR